MQKSVSPLRILIADDHEIVREGLRTLLSEEAQIDVVGEAANGREAVAFACRLRPDVILMDLVMPEMSGIEAIKSLREQGVESRIVILTSFVDNTHVREALQAGAIGYLMKDILKEDLLRAIRDAALGEPTLHAEAQKHLIRQVTTPAPPSRIEDLSDREREVLTLITRGNSNKEIAAALRITEGTVKGYVSSILSKLEVADRTQAALYAVKNGVE